MILSSDLKSKHAADSIIAHLNAKAFSTLWDIKKK